MSIEQPNELSQREKGDRYVRIQAEASRIMNGKLDDDSLCNWVHDYGDRAGEIVLRDPACLALLEQNEIEKAGQYLVDKLTGK